MFAGYRTYIIAVLLAAVTAGEYLGWLTKEAATALQGVLLSGGLATLRAAVK